MNEKQTTKVNELSKLGRIERVTMIKRTVYLVVIVESKGVKSFDTWKVTVKGKAVLVG